MSANAGIQASRTLTIHFTSKGGSYTAIWMSNRGDLYQEFQKVDATTTNYYPNITSGNANSHITMNLSVASARSGGLVIPDTVTYYANGIELAFNNDGVCTTGNFSDIFMVSGGKLVIIGNLGKVANNASFQLQAKVGIGADVLWASAPVTMAPWLGGDNARVTIAPGDDNNFTIKASGGSCDLKALVTKGGEIQPASNFDYEWYVFKSGSFVQVKDDSNAAVTTQTLTVLEREVFSYALYKLVVKENGTEVGSDTQGVMDASDPYDIVLTAWVNDGNGGNDVSTNNLELNDEMPDGAYIKVKAMLVVRGETTAAVTTGTKKYKFAVVSANGAQLFGQASSTNDTYKLTKKNMDDNGAGIGDYEIVVDCTVD